MFAVQVRVPWLIQWPGWRSRIVSLNARECLECNAGCEAAHRRARPCWPALPAPKRFHARLDGAQFPRANRFSGTDIDDRETESQFRYHRAVCVRGATHVRFSRCRSGYAWKKRSPGPEPPTQIARGKNLRLAMTHRD